jgi:hypothetical protein
LLEILAQCLVKCAVLPGTAKTGEVLRRVRQSVDEILGLSESELLAVTAERMDEVWSLLSAGSPSHVDPCIEKCLKLLDAVFCVAKCAVEYRELGVTYPEMLVDCLAGCKQRLSEAHDMCVQACMDECMSLKKELKYPSDPYLPQATALTVSYSAVCTVSTTGLENACGSFYHLLPFGGYDRPSSADKETTLLPYVNNPGNLYIGFSGMLPPQTLTLLFQMAADCDNRSVQPPQVSWDYLSGNEWTRLHTSEIRADSTNGLQNSGVIILALPDYDPANNTVLSGDYQWLRASVRKKPGRFPETIGVYPHAGLATWRNVDNTGEHLRKPLPAHTINSSVQDLPDIDTIDQPMESFGGRPPETGRDFEMRVGERLQHKDRGILGWDYERLVLERFPTVWKVQTLPARNSRQGHAPGDVLVVIVPGQDSIQTVDPTTPKATSEMLNQIQTYLEGLISPFIRLQVVNPVYVRITVVTTVEFKSDEDTGACIERLNNELKEYLSPWFYDASRAATEGQYGSEADISEFIQTRPYVEAMISIALFYEPDPQTLDWCFFTSALQHYVSVTEPVSNGNSI